MLTLYFSPGACSTASHIGIEESGAPYTEKPTLLGKQEQKTSRFSNQRKLGINDASMIA